MSADHTDERLLLPALEAARRALQRLDDDELSPPLRRVAASSARRLPPPLRDRLLAELDRSEWLRGRAMEELEADRDDPAASASELYLARPPEWETRLAELSGRRREADAERSLRAMEAERERLRKQVEELEGRLEQSDARGTAAVQEAVADAVAGLQSEVGRLKASNARLRRELEALERRHEQAESRIEMLGRDLAEADGRIGELRERVLETRQTSAGAEPGREARPFGRGSPLEMARALDHLHQALLPPPPRPEGRRPSPWRPRLPEGIRPDAADAIEWLLGVEVPLLLLVDGYNVIHEAGWDAGPSGRSRLVHALARLRRLADGPLTCVAFFDSPHPEPDAPPGGVEVRYVPSADDAIVARAAGGGSVVVVSGDREVRERCNGEGVLALWSSALASWIRR